MFDFDSELLERLVREIALYYLNRAERMMTEPNRQVETLQRLNWAQRLWYNYDQMLQQIPVRESTQMTEINDLIRQVESTLVSLENSNDKNDDDEKIIEESGS